MAKEIERKFLINEPEWDRSCHYCPAGYNETGISQAYLFDIFKHVARIRTTRAIDSKAIFTYKGPTKGITRTEVEFEIPYWLGDLILSCKSKVIHKTRIKARLPNSDLVAEVDLFHNVEGIKYIAEIELPSEDTKFVKPSWLGEEVSHDPQYYNSNLINKVI